MSKRVIYLAPLSLFLVLAVYFAIGLTKDPKILPSALIDKPVPEFSLAPIDNGTPQGYGKGFSSEDLKKGGISVVNVFASWCLPCRVEHPFITKLAKMNVAKVYGLNFKDAPKYSLKWLKELGDPYDAIGVDQCLAVKYAVATPDVDDQTVTKRVRIDRHDLSDTNRIAHPATGIE